MRYQGRIADWNDAKGFGFVTPNGGGERSFVHIKAFTANHRRPQDGDLITYEPATDPAGRLRAVNIRFAGDVPAPPNVRHRTARQSPIAIAYTTFFCAVVGVLTLMGKLPALVSYIYALASLFTFLVYAFDKSAAQNNRQRTPEKTLHLLALIGGWPGALAAQRMFRHKSIKAEFQSAFWLTVIVNSLALGWLLTSSGAAFIGNALQTLR
ncbi:MAG: cold shock and DUF1294 domain-containing protein [Xanthomonadales bacterium]|nr:cold shock and DUF1294 domain-containing protein [Xanthomonadales bacterium]MDZ4115944.1 cold shock and DUF1294 domain-containing protein [Xanthomonadaceae bacterium]MDZ4378146.1 cold shock and DUF1294 domain-containing protein [Xanthomonadaceae bacterium]